MATKKKAAAKAKKPPVEDQPPISIPTIVKTKWKQDVFYSHCRLTDDSIAKANIHWTELAAIFDDHTNRSDALNTTAVYVSEVLRRIPVVHSVRVRVKDPSHLIEKIIRKRTADPNRDIRFSNYRYQITDLVGIRALHLYKADWRVIHCFVVSEWELIEKPTAYIRKGDSEQLKQEFEEAGCVVRDHPQSYRSVHYVLKSAPSKQPVNVELQVRTIFEEGWSEIDHRVNYPKPAHSIASRFLNMFNRVAGTADEMGTFIDELVSELSKIEQELADNRQQNEATLKKLEETIKDLDISESKREELQTEVSSLRSKRLSAEPGYFSSIFGNEAKLEMGAQLKPATISDYLASSIVSRSRQCDRCGSLYTPPDLTIADYELCETCRLFQPVTLPLKTF